MNESGNGAGINAAALGNLGADELHFFNLVSVNRRNVPAAPGMRFIGGGWRVIDEAGLQFQGPVDQDMMVAFYRTDSSGVKSLTLFPVHSNFFQDLADVTLKNMHSLEKGADVVLRYRVVSRRFLFPASSPKTSP